VRLLLALLLAAPSDPVDLLGLLDLSKDTVAGEWKREGTALVTSEVRFGRVMIPYVPPAEYDLRAVVERTAGDVNSLVFGIAVGDRQGAVMIDAFNHDTTSGLDLVDGKSFPDNETAHKGQILKAGKKSEVRISVRRNSLLVAVDGQPVVAWKADWRRVSLFPQWKVGVSSALFLGAWTTAWKIHRCELIPVSGPGCRLRD
jgi:hypothetical protein